MGKGPITNKPKGLVVVLGLFSSPMIRWTVQAQTLEKNVGYDVVVEEHSRALLCRKVNLSSVQTFCSSSPQSPHLEAPTVPLTGN